MIQTGKQATKALKFIHRKTGWTGRKIARRLGTSWTTEWKIYNGQTKNPAQEIMDAIENLQAEVETI